MNCLSDPLFSVKDKVIVLTGACGQIGSVLTEALYKREANLVLIDIPEVDPVSEALRYKSDRIVGIACDISKEEEIIKAKSVILDKFKRVDVLINNHQYKPKGFLDTEAEDFPLELWDQIMDVNLRGTFISCREFGKEMLQQKKGSIINLASTYGVVSSNPDLYQDNNFGNPVAYSASKGGVVMLSKYLGAYWADRGVRVNCISPHGIGTKFEENFKRRFCEKSPMKRTMKAEEIIGAVLFLASEASSYATAGNLLIEGGWTAW